MKSAFTLLLLAFCFAVTAGGNRNTPQLGFATSLNQAPAIEHRPLLAKPALSYDADKCRRYKGMTIGGAVALGVGAGLFSGGVVLLDIGVNAAVYDNTDVNTVGYIVGGSVMVVWGLVGMAAGIPITTIGATKMRRYCGNESSMNLMLLKSGTNMGLALRF